MKYCGICEQEKSESEFHKRKASKDGLSSKCKTCQKVYDKARANDPYREEQRRIYQQTEIGRAAANKAKAKWRKENPNKAKAHAIVARAIRAGHLFSKPCCECGSTSDVHGHHDDYLEPLNVRWLCAPCHSQWHKENGEGKNA